MPRPPRRSSHAIPILCTVFWLCALDGCASTPSLSGSQAININPVWDDYFARPDRDSQPCPAGEFPVYCGTYADPPGRKFFNTRFDYHNGDSFFIGDNGPRKQLKLFRTSEGGSDTQLWIALFDGETQRYWIVTGDGWSGERYYGPYQLRGR